LCETNHIHNSTLRRDVNVCLVFWECHTSLSEEQIAVAKHILITWVTWGYLKRGRDCLPLANTWGNPRFLVASVLLIVLIFCVVKCFCFICWSFCAQCRCLATAICSSEREVWHSQNTRHTFTSRLKVELCIWFVSHNHLFIWCNSSIWIVYFA
jgi:hypothetical protein